MLFVLCNILCVTQVHVNFCHVVLCHTKIAILGAANHTNTTTRKQVHFVKNHYIPVKCKYK